jgi:hypothetical protein
MTAYEVFLKAMPRLLRMCRRVPFIYNITANGHVGEVSRRVLRRRGHRSDEQCALSQTGRSRKLGPTPIEQEDVIEIVRVLHERMEPSRQIDKQPTEGDTLSPAAVAGVC